MRFDPSRRHFFSRMSDGVHGAALASLLGGDLLSAATLESGPRVYDLKPRAPHFPPKAKAVIQLFQNGGPSQVDLFDPKPMLTKFAGSAPSRDIVNQIEFADQVGLRASVSLSSLPNTANAAWRSLRRCRISPDAWTTLR